MNNTWRRRFMVLPFETLIAIFAVYSGLVSLLHVGPTATALTALLPTWLTVMLNVLYLVAGSLMLYGLGRPDRGIEAFGLVLVAASVIVRMTAFLILGGITTDTINGAILNLLTIGAVSVRLHTLLSGGRVVLLDGESNERS